MNNFSVLMSLYHKENPLFLKESLQSIFDNTIQPNQVVLVLDGPIGNELKSIVNDFIARYPSLEVYPQPKNQGLSTALNIGLQKCKNDIVFRMDTDDVCAPNRFERILKEYELNPALEIVGSSCYNIDEKGNIDFSAHELPLTEESIYKKVWMCPFIHPAVSFRKQSIIRVGSYNPNSGPRQDDYELWFRCIAGGLHCKNISSPLLYYRVTCESVGRMDVRVGWWRAKVGMRGAWKCKCPPIAYIGVWYPFFRSLLPLRLQRWLYKNARKILN